MITDENSRNRVIERLKKANWISKVNILTNDKEPNRVRMQIEWTDYGKERRKQFSSIFEELEFRGRWGGEFDALLDMCLISPFENMGQSGDTPSQNPRI